MEHILLTDLFLSSKQLVGGTLKQLTKPLKKILKNGKSIGLGVMSSFNGTIYSKKRRWNSIIFRCSKRPFYIIIIGDQKEINIIKKNLEEKHFIDEDDNYKFSLITSMPVFQNLNQNKLIIELNIKNKISKAENFKFNYTNDNLANYEFNIKNKNKIKFKFDKNKIIVPGSSGVSNFSIKIFFGQVKK